MLNSTPRCKPKMKILKSLIKLLLVLVVLGAIACVALHIINDRETKELSHNLRKTTNGNYIELSQGITHYELDGPDNGKVVVMLHGFSVPYYIWNGTYEYLVDHGFKVLRYDMYGRGYSDRPDVTYNKDLYLNQLNELIEKLKLDKPVSLAGISFGGAVATDFAATYPNLVDKVILIDPAFKIEKPDLFPFITDFKEVMGADKRAYGQMDDFKYPDRHPSWVEEYTPQMEYKGFRRALVSTQFNYPYDGKASSAQLSAKNKQVLLVWGKEDKTVPFAISDQIKSVLKCEFLPVDDAGHLPFLDQPEIVNPALVTFLQK